MTIYFGEEDFLVQRAVKTKKEEFLKKNSQSSVEIFDGGENIVEDLLLSIGQGGGLFAKKKMVILRDVFNYDKVDQEKILDFLKKKNNSLNDIELIISWRGKIKANKLLNFLKKNEQKQEFKKITLFETEKFIQDKLEGLNEVESGAMKKLALLYGKNLWVLDRELEKLINFKSGEKITEDDLKEMSDGEVGVKIFDLVDAIGNQNKKRAYELLDSLFKKGEDGFYILSMMIFQIRNLSLVLDCQNKGIFNQQEIAQKTGLHPFVVQKALAQLSRFNVDRLKKIYKRALFLDINSKSGRININEALEDFIIKI